MATAMPTENKVNNMENGLFIIRSVSYIYYLRILLFTKPQEVEVALEEEAKKLRLADGGVLLESLRTRRLLETAELALKVRRVPS